MRIFSFHLLDDWKLWMCFEQEVALAKRQFGKINTIPGGGSTGPEMDPGEVCAPSCGRGDEEGRPRETSWDE